MPELGFDGIGTRWRIDTAEPLAAGVAAAVRDAVDAFDRVWSRFRDDSLVARIARDAGTHRVDADGIAMLEAYDALARATDGAVNPLVGHALEDLGYDAAYRLRRRASVRAVPSWSQIAWTVGDDGGGEIHAGAPVLLDVGALGKGRLVDIVGRVLADTGVTEYVIDAGGDLLHRGPRPIRVALEHPGDPHRAVGVVELRDGALAGSATNRRAWGAGLHHVLDARTSSPVPDVLAAWALAPTAMAADAAATALFFLPPDDVPFAEGAVRMPARGPLEAARFPGTVFA